MARKNSFNERAKRLLKERRTQLTQSFSDAQTRGDKAGAAKHEAALARNSQLLKLAYDGALRRKSLGEGGGSSSDS